MMGVMFLSVIPLTLILLRSKTSRIRNLYQQFDEQVMRNNRYYFAIVVVFASIVIGSIAYQILVLAGNVFWERAIVQRVSPLILFSLGTAVILLLEIISWRGWFSYPFVRYINGLKNFFSIYPSFIYMLISVGLIGIAQLFDKNWLNIFGIGWYPDLLIGDLTDWFEDGFELTAGVELILAGFFIGCRSDIQDT